ncbi:hypothetical protein BN938_0397 [Mucinivorans hirudinis]|uniref:Uncharacterized protein n=1 Tax=Mucinivorans hirudinis TaxID=1433126 RepID=A0A060R6E1_9BACT|nr:hypothetical protein BN938_0397 [Mucinivorans hirudinis]
MYTNNQSHIFDPTIEIEEYYTHSIDGVPVCHKSWKELRRPNDDMLLTQYYDEYCNLIANNKNLCHIPEEVLRQWIYPFNDDANSLRNYAWIDYYKSRFVLCELDIETLCNEVNVNEYGSELVSQRGSLRDFSDFCWTDEDIACWANNKTWNTPPVILDVKSFGNIPKWADISGTYQLIEGHQRLGYLRAVVKMAHVGKTGFKTSHKVYLLHNQ